MLCWAKRVEVQRAQSAIINSLTEVKEFDRLKKQRIHIKTALEDHPHGQKHLQNSHADTVIAVIPPDNAWAMGRKAQNATKLAISEQCVEAGGPEP